MRLSVVALTAELSVDYTVSADHVILSDGENIKLVPVTLIASTSPKLARSFIVRLLNSTTGGAAVGRLAQCTVTVLETYDAHGVFGNQYYAYNSPLLRIKIWGKPEQVLVIHGC